MARDRKVEWMLETSRMLIVTMAGRGVNANDQGIRWAAETAAKLYHATLRADEEGPDLADQPHLIT